jgi:hypothetical protein
MRLGRKPKSVVAAVTVATAVLAAFGIVPSLASWTDTEYDHGTVSPLDCAAPGGFTTQAWGQEVAGSVAGVPLDSNLVEVQGVSTSSGTPHSTATGGAGSSGLTYLANDAWSNDLQVGALNGISLGVGLSLPLDQNFGAETQYARATTTGVATGASGALTDSGGGLVSLATPSPSAPGVGSVGLTSAMAATVGDKLAGQTDQLSDPALDVGAVGSMTDLDSCNALWQGVSDASAVARHYVLSKLGLDFSSSLVGAVVSDASSTVSDLSTTLNGLQTSGTPVSNPTLTSALTSALSDAGVTLGGPTTVQVDVGFDLAPVTDLLTSTLTSGPVSIDLATGEITADIAGLAGVDLNALPANSPLLTPSTLALLSTHLSDAVNDFITGPFTSAFTSVLDSATVSAAVSTDITVLGIDAANVDIAITGSASQFVTPGGAGGAPTVTVAGTALLPSVGLININTLVSGLVSGLVSPVATRVVPALTSAVVTPLLGTADGDVTRAVTALDGTVLVPVLASLSAVVDVIGDALQLTVNVEPDQANPVGSPESTSSGRFFESALKIGVLDTMDSSSTLGLFLGSSSAGPNTED